MHLLAKVTRPRGGRALRRARLFAVLDRAREGRAAWVHGEDGAGKTTLLATYVEARKLPCLWYRLDEADADPGTFLHGLRLAAPCNARRAEPCLPLAAAELGAGAGPSLRRCFRSLSDCAPAPFLLVFDDYHRLDPGSPVHALLAQAIPELPPGATAVFLSRTPPHPLLPVKAATDVTP
ncbi:MAG TPA: AAA family ATPase, partial [Vicinamibacteria bacterium]|nr:AAA family ATPase [Vicinamibacteria bacterium]